MRIYLDNAATSWPKPPQVVEAMARYLEELGAPAGRSAYRAAGEVGRLVDAARGAMARLLGAESPERIIFTQNGTDALNLAIHGLLCEHDHVVTTAGEHNSVLRPLRTLEEAGRITVDRAACDHRGIVDCDALRRALRRGTRLVAISHASKVTGAIQPVAQAARLAREHGARVLVDAAQSLGHVPLDVQALDADLLAAPGHKGLLGPPGTGVLYIRPGVEAELASVRQGGTGTASEDDRQPDELPHKYEAGSLNVAGIVGLGAAAEWLLDHNVEKLRDREQMLADRLLDGLARIDGVQVHGPEPGTRRVGVVSISLAGYDPQEAAAVLDEAYGIQVRAGLHCAPGMHAALVTLERGGTLRFSLGPFSSQHEIDAAIAAVAELCEQAGHLRDAGITKTLPRS
jgi:cysteine desulfurase / selenocysteine lyase